MSFTSSSFLTSNLTSNSMIKQLLAQNHLRSTPDPSHHTPALFQPPHLPPQFLSHFLSNLLCFLLIQILPYPTPKHRPAAIANLRYPIFWARNHVEVHVRHDLGSSK